MRDILPEIQGWHAEGRRVALATVVKVWGSAPRPLGSSMAVTDRDQVAGSVSGGCVEGAVIETAREVLASGQAQLVHFGVSNEEAWAVGLSCGGEIEVFVAPWGQGEVESAVERRLQAEQTAVLATTVVGPGLGQRLLLGPGEERVGGLEAAGAEQVAIDAGPQLLHDFASKRLSLEESADTEVFVQVLTPRPLLVIVGAVHVAIPLVSMAKTLGMATAVVDPRATFASRERFPHVDHLSTLWPDQALEQLSLGHNSYVALLSHDLKLDVPAIRVALQRQVRYIGALGSKKTHAKRARALEEEGISRAEIGRLHNPIGLKLGGRRAEEIAVAVIAQIVGVSHGLDYRPPV